MKDGWVGARLGLGVGVGVESHINIFSGRAVSNGNFNCSLGNGPLSYATLYTFACDVIAPALTLLLWLCCHLA